MTAFGEQASSAIGAPGSVAPLRTLFVPVSGAHGMGEYARCLAIALALAQRAPGAVIHFVLSEAASYAGDAPFPKTLVPHSPTLHPKEVSALIGKFQPHVVVFDNAGRTAQLKAARQVGAKVIFISSRSRPRRRAFRLRWMRLLDEHWIAYPRFIAGAPTGFEQFKLRMAGRTKLRYLDTVQSEPSPAQAAATLGNLGLESEGYLLVIPGGGTGHPGLEHAPRIMGEAAGRLASHGHRIVFIGHDSAVPTHPLVQGVARVPMIELMALMQNARLVLTSGGDTLLQALACRRPCVAAPIAGDQPLRIARCQAAGLVVGTELQPAAMEVAALSLLNDGHLRSQQLANMERQRLANGLDTAVAAIITLAQAAQSHRHS